MPDKLSSVAGHILHFGCISPKKMSCQFQLHLQGILLNFSLTSLPLNCTEVGRNVKRVAKHLPDLPDMSGTIRNSSNCLFILDLEFFQKLINLSVNSCPKTWTFVNIRERWQMMTNDCEIVWNLIHKGNHTSHIIRKTKSIPVRKLHKILPMGIFFSKIPYHAN